jgi:hypothetical protein
MTLPASLDSLQYVAPIPPSPPTRPSRTHDGSKECLDSLNTRIDSKRTFETEIANIKAVQDRFVDFVNTLRPRLQTMQMLRPDLMEKPFDTIYDNGRLKVVDTDMTHEEKAWVEEQLNIDGVLARLADAFNRQVVRTYDEDNGAWDEAGVFHGHVPLNGDAFNESISYLGLDRTVNASVKLISLCNDVRDYNLPCYMDESDRDRMGGHLVQKYLDGELSRYVKRPDGTVELQTERGSFQHKGLWI